MQIAMRRGIVTLCENSSIQDVLMSTILIPHKIRWHKPRCRRSPQARRSGIFVLIRIGYGNRQLGDTTRRRLQQMCRTGITCTRVSYIYIHICIYIYDVHTHVHICNIWGTSNGVSGNGAARKPEIGNAMDDRRCWLSLHEILKSMFQ